MIITRPCAYCTFPFTGNHKLRYCNDLCRARAAFHRMAGRAPDPTVEAEYLWRWYKKTAQCKTTHMEFSLSELDVKRCLGGLCFYCPQPATQIDRWDSARGYLPHNVVGACGPCNGKKGSWPGDEYVNSVTLKSKR